MAALESDREHARKRKERRDSGCTHERKERRAHSEERPPPPPPLHDCNRLEAERRAERLSRARRPHQPKRRRAAPRPRAQENLEDAARTPSPPARLEPPAHALHRQLGCDEPERSWGADEDYNPPAVAAPPSPPATDASAELTQPEKRLQQIRNKIHSLKKSILKSESEFETSHGRSMTHADRMMDIQLTQLYEALQRLQAEKRCLKADPAAYALQLLAACKQKEEDDRLDAALSSDKSMSDLVVDIEQWLSSCRAAGGRAGAAGTWSTAELTAEKACVQRALLRLEAARGRPPTHSADRGAARHLYDQYRQVKRALAARSDATLGAQNGELATILEHEPMLFPGSSVDSSSDSQERRSEASENTTRRPSPTSSPPARNEDVPSSNSSAKSAPSDDTPAELIAMPSNEGLHCLTLEELTRIFCETKLQKSVLRRSIKEYEMSFEVQHSRKLQKDDKKIKEEDYVRYKALKARLRLINALMNKQKNVKAT